MNSIGANDLNHLQDFVNTLFLRLRGRRRKYTIIDIFAAAADAAAADGFIRTRFCFLRHALALLSRVHLFLTEEWQSSISAARQTKKPRTDRIKLKRVTSSLKCDLFNLCIIMIIISIGTHGDDDDGGDDEEEAKEIRQASTHATAIKPYTICGHRQHAKSDTKQTAQQCEKVIAIAYRTDWR